MTLEELRDAIKTHTDLIRMLIDGTNLLGDLDRAEIKDNTDNINRVIDLRVKGQGNDNTRN